MKRLSKLLFAISIISCVFVLTGCKKEEEKKDVNESTVATKLVSEFDKLIESETDIEKIATKISESEIIEIAVGVMEALEGYLDGFDGEVKGFKNAYAVKPMIGGQPFIAYVFEANNGEEFAKTLKETANKRWNICTEADELEVSVKDNYVFLVMSPKNFDE